MKITCKKHPRYKVIYFPKANCGACRLLYFLKVANKRVELDLQDGSHILFTKN